MVQQRKMSRYETCLVLGSAAVALLLGEASFRWLLPAQYRLHQRHRRVHNRASASEAFDPQIGWVLANGTVDSREDAGGSQPDLVYSIRNGERLTSAQLQNGPRIVATGCSFTFGQLLKDASSWPWLLQERLPTYHVVNVANMAYGTDQALLAAERHVLHFPGEVDTVVLGFGDFQIERNRCGQSWLAGVVPFAKPLFMRNGAGVEYKGQARFWSLGSFADSFIDHSALLSRAANVITDRLVYHIESHAEARQTTIALIQEFAQRFQSRRIRFVVAVLPWGSDQMPQSKLDRRLVVEQLRAADITVLEPHFPRLPDGTLDKKEFLNGGHPNRRYNLLLADELAALLKQPAPR